MAAIDTPISFMMTQAEFVAILPCSATICFIYSESQHKIVILAKSIVLIVVS